MSIERYTDGSITVPDNPDYEVRIGVENSKVMHVHWGIGAHYRISRESIIKILEEAIAYVRKE